MGKGGEENAKFPRIYSKEEAHTHTYAMRADMRQYDYLAFEPENFPKNAVRVEKCNIRNNGRVLQVYFDKADNKLCSAKLGKWTPDKPVYCGMFAVYKNGRCRMHGGRARMGTESPRYKDGKYSSYLPQRLAEKYSEAQNDEQLHTLNNEIQLVDARLKDLIETANEGGATTIFKDIQDAWNAFNAAKRARDTFKLQEASQRLDNAVQSGTKEALAWLQIEKLLDTRRKLVLAEGKRLQMLDQFVPIERVNLMLGFIVALINQQVADRTVSAKLISDVLKLTGRGSTSDAGAVSRTSGQRMLPSGTPPDTEE